MLFNLTSLPGANTATVTYPSFAIDLVHKFLWSSDMFKGHQIAIEICSFFFLANLFNKAINTSLIFVFSIVELLILFFEFFTEGFSVS